MSTLLPSTIPVPLLLAGAFVIIILGLTAYSFFVTLFAMQIPDVKAQIISQMKRRAFVLMHYSNRRAQGFCPKRKGKKQQENTLNLPDHLGTKFDPSGSGLEEIWGKSILYHFYSKSTNSMTPEQAKAVHDFSDFCAEKGIAVNEELIDVLVVENLDIQDVYTKTLLDRVLKNLPLPISTEKERWLNEDFLNSEYNRLKIKIAEFQEIRDETTDEKEIQKIEATITDYNANLTMLDEKYQDLAYFNELKKELAATTSEIDTLADRKHELIDEIDIVTGYLDQDTRKTIYTLKRLQEDLKKRVIREGQFVFPKVHDFVFAASSLNGAGMTEAISISKADAIMQNADDKKGFTLEVLFGGVIIIVILFFGLGLAYKTMFG